MEFFSHREKALRSAPIRTRSARAFGLLVLVCLGCGSRPTVPSPSPAASGPTSAPIPAPAADRETRGSEVRGAQQGGDGSPDGSPRYLIVHADDAGMCRSVNRATIDALEQGIVTSVSLMAPCPAIEEFATYAREHPERDYGAHLTLNAEFLTFRWGPVLPRAEVPSLVDPAGFLWRDEKQTAARARADEVERELGAQIERLRKLGVTLSHLDSHMGTLMTRSDLLDVYVRLGSKYQLPILFVRDRKVVDQFQVISRDVRARIDDVAATFARQKLPLLDGLYMHYQVDSDCDRRTHYVNVFRNLPAGVSELIVHCAYNDGELMSGAMRDADRRFVTDPSARRELSRLGIELIDWKRFRLIAHATASPREPSPHRNTNLP